MKKHTRVTLTALSLSIGLGATFAATVALAEDAAQPALAEIIVTAQKRSENLQDVPISVVAVSAQQIKDAGVTDIRSLTILTPGLTVTSEGNEAITTARIRGIGTVGDNPGLESSVGVNIDGVYRPRNGVAFGDLGEIEQIEVLYGPQGELFGKNNDAGVINVTTKRPSSTFQSMAELTGGNFNDREAKGSITGPLTNWASGRVYVGYQQNTGFLQLANGIGPNTEENTNSRKNYTVRGQLLLTPSDDLDMLFIADYTKRNESCCGAVLQYPGPFEGLVNAYASTPALGGKSGALGISPATGTPVPNSYLAYANQPITQHVRDYGVSGELNWNLGFGKLTSITAWRDNTVSGANDVDYSGIDVLKAPDDDSLNATDFKQFSEELRLAGKNGPLNWLVGFFFNSESLTPNGTLQTGSQFENYIDSVAQASAGAAPFPPSAIATTTGNAPGTSYLDAGYQDRYHQDSKSYALFTNETWNIAQGLDLTAGLRATKEKKTATAEFTNLDGGFGCGSLLNANNGNLFKLLALPANERNFLIGYGCFSGVNPFFSGQGFNQSNDEGNVSGTLKLSYRFNDQLMTYISAANGYKAGGYNLSRVTYPANPTGACPANSQGLCPIAALGPAAGIYSVIGVIPNLDTAFPRETVQSAEIGIKSTLFDRTLRLNAAVFYQRYKDFQLNTFTGIQFVVTSLNRVVSKGADLDFAWATPLAGLSFNGGVTYAFTNIDDFGSALSYFATDRLNDRLSFAPLWSSAVSAVYTVPFNSAIGLRTSIEEKYTSKYDTGSDLDPRKNQGAFGLMNLRVGVGAPDESWAVEAWAANLTNKYYYGVAFDAPFQFENIDSYLGAPRTFGLTARVKFK